MVVIDGEYFGPDECNGTGRCEVSEHVHGCYSDFGRCDEPDQHESFLKEQPSEECRICRDGQTITFDENESIPLCNGHWDRWLARYLGNPDAPCAAHVIRD